MITITSQHEYPDGSIAYRLSNGWVLIAAGDGVRVNYTRGRRYGVWAMPAHGPAAAIGGADSLDAALALAAERQRAMDVNLTRMAFGEDYR